MTSRPTIIITGASDGIGAAAARQLAELDARLILVGRSPQKTRAVAGSEGAEHYTADFARLDDVRSLAEKILAATDRIDVLANNAGGIFSGPEPTEDGFEKTFQVNHLAPFLLTNLLLETLLSSQARVVNTSSVGARLFSRLDLEDLNTWEKYAPNRAYGNAKLANILFTQGLHRRFHHQGLSAVAFHPGVIATSFGSQASPFWRWTYQGVLRRLLTSPQKGGANLVHFILGEPGIDWTSGEFYGSNRQLARTARAAGNPEIADRHWQLSAEMLGVRNELVTGSV